MKTLRKNQDSRIKKLFFFIFVIFALLPIVIFPCYSAFFHQVSQVPKVSDGVLDLQGYDLKHHREIPLDGEWEFYWQKWLVTDKIAAATPDKMIKVPSPWSWADLNGERLPQEGYASYRIRLLNCPENMDLISYIPNINAAYRIFINGVQVSGYGVMEKETNTGEAFTGLSRERFHFASAPESELVVEISSSYVGGLYLPPMLSENKSDHFISELRETVLAAYVGVLLLTIGICATLFVLRRYSVRHVALLVLDVLVLIRILLKDELFGLLKTAVPLFQYPFINMLIQICTLFLPIVFLNCIQDATRIPNGRRIVWYITVYELLLAFPLAFCILKGYLVFEYLLVVLSMLPFGYVLLLMYRGLESQPYVLTSTLGISLTISSLILADQYTSGLLVINFSMFPPTCFVICSILQVYIFVRESNRAYHDVLENTNLRLKLKESETSLMLSQIQPHFLYNALIAIQVLCAHEPETAEEAIVKFSKFLRANMQSLKSAEPIPFRQELEHVHNYVAIEKLRFKERLTVCCEIEADDFRVPPLTIQPLVENAIKHGACKNIAGGTVTLKSYADAVAWIVEISDNGPGFDVAALEKENGHSCGLQNITFRLKEIMGAEISIVSSREGTTVTVRLPKVSSAAVVSGNNTGIPNREVSGKGVLL